MKNKKNITLREQLQNQTEKTVERCKIGTLTHKYVDCSLFWIGTGTSIKSGGFQIFIEPKPILLVRCKCSQHVSKIPTYTGTNIKWRG
jgi:hypothetical protein